MDRQRVNLDGFAIEDAELGLTALRSPHDPEPGLVITDGRVTELDGVPEAEFDSIDTYIARHGLDLSVAPEAMALSDVSFARLLVDPAVPRHERTRGFQPWVWRLLRRLDVPSSRLWPAQCSIVLVRRRTLAAVR